MHKQIASTAFSLAVTLTASILPSHEIKFSSDEATQVQQTNCVSPKLEETQRAQHSFAGAEHEPGFFIQFEKGLLDAPLTGD